MLARTGRPAEQIAVRHASAGECAAQTRLDGVISQKAGKVHVRCSFLGLYFALYHSSITDFPPLCYCFFSTRKNRQGTESLPACLALHLPSEKACDGLHEPLLRLAERRRAVLAQKQDAAH